MINTVAIIRQRYQLTLPTALRSVFDWIQPENAITIKALNKDKILIEPIKRETVDWRQIDKNLQKIRSWMGKTSLTEFVIQDRENRR